MNGLYLALQSDKEHCNLRHSPLQIEIVDGNGTLSLFRIVSAIGMANLDEVEGSGAA